MGLFFDVLSSINNPNQGGSIAQLSQITGTVNELTTNNGLNPSAMQGIMSSLGPLLRPVLKEQATGGNNSLENVMNQFTGGGATGGLGGGLESIFAGPIQSQITNTIAQKTGLDSSMLQGIVPKLLPVVMGLLNMGKTTGGTGGGGNPLLTAFLDSDKDGDVDLGDVFKFANRFLNPGR